MCIYQQDFRINLRNLVRGMHSVLPPSNDTMLRYYQAGIFDAVRFLRAEGYYDAHVEADRAALKASVAV